MNHKAALEKYGSKLDERSRPAKGQGDCSIRLVITGGGTGGHVFPGVAIAEELEARCDLECLWIGTGRPIEEKVLNPRPWAYEVLEVKPLKGRSPLNVVSALIHLPFSILRAMMILGRFGPDAVLGVGGYISGPVLAAARLLRIPSAIHEQNLLPGLANKLASRFADVVFVSFDASKSSFAGHRVKCLGNPVRRQILEQAISSGRKSRNGPLHILILGGSQGASGLNRLAASALRLLRQSGRRFSVIHQTGPMDYQEMLDSYKESGIEAAVHEFINEMGIAYSWADLIICRAGATTLAEITAIGRPAICIPYPYSADGHQGLNAKAILEAGAGLYFEEGDVGAVRLASEIEKLMSNPRGLAEMTKNARQLGRPEAAAQIAEELLQLCRKGKQQEYSIERNRGETVHGHV